jgi:hypothetical protein
MDIETRLARLEAIEAITALKAQYCLACDADYDFASVAPMLAEGFWFDGGAGFGRHHGRAGFKAFWDTVRGDIRFAAHLVLNPDITVTGADTARAKWRLLMPCTVTTGGAPEARWLLCEYDETYVRAGGVWLFETITMQVNFYAPHLKGWA